MRNEWTREQLETALDKARADLARSSTHEETERAYRAIYSLQDELDARFPRRRYEWKPIETAPVDGRDVIVREHDGKWGEAFCDNRRRWRWRFNFGKAYPTEWKPEPHEGTGRERVEAD